MLETRNPEIDVDALMMRLRNRIAEFQLESREIVPSQTIALRNNVFVNSLEAFVNIADQKAQVRTEWPSHIVAPLAANTKLRKVFLDLLAFLFKDQRHVNQSLIAAFRESISLNRHLIEQVEALRKDHESLKKAIGATTDPP